MHPDIDGMEFDWFGTDRAGNIALFATAGAGFVPAAVVSTLAEHKSRHKFLHHRNNLIGLLPQNLETVFENECWALLRATLTGPHTRHGRQ